MDYYSGNYTHGMEGPTLSNLKASDDLSEEKSVEVFPNFRDFLNKHEIIAYRKESGERFRLRDWREDREGSELIKIMSERLYARDKALVAEYRLAKNITLKEGVHKMIENTAKSLSLYPPKRKKYKGVDFQDMSQEFEAICGKFYNFRLLESSTNLRSVQSEAMFLSDFGDAYCGMETPKNKSSEERMMVRFIELADNYARSTKDVENDTVRKLFRALNMDTLISKASKDELDKFWSENQNTIITGAVMAGAIALGLSYLASKSRQGRSR